MSWLFKLRGDVPKKWVLVLEALGISIILLLWIFLTMGESPVIPSKILPKPTKVLGAYSVLIEENSLIKNSFRSIGLNLAGYIKAILWTIPIGFIIGLYPLFKGMYQRSLDAVRFVPIAAAIGIFIAWFGISSSMKVNFLAFGIFIFLSPIVVQRINEVKDVYLKTVYTIGATDWQTIWSVYIPSVFSKLIDDIRILTAISWTYIVVIETINSEEGGLGALTWTSRRLSKPENVYALLILIIIIGIIQDRIFVQLDKELMPHKYQQKIHSKQAKLKGPGVLETIWNFTFTALVWIVLALYVVLALNEFTGALSDIKVIHYLFGNTCWAFHLVMLSIIAYKAWKLSLNFSNKKKQSNEPVVS